MTRHERRVSTTVRSRIDRDGVRVHIAADVQAHLSVNDGRVPPERQAAGGAPDGGDDRPGRGDGAPDRAGPGAQSAAPGAGATTASRAVQRLHLRSSR